MRTLSSSLLAAQKAASRVPYVKVEIVEKIGGVVRLLFERLYQGGETDNYHATTMPGDGSLVRARIDPADAQLYRQRVASPGPGSNFSSWTAVEIVSSVSALALGSYGASVLLFYVGTDQRTVYLRESADYGATFGSANAVLTASNTVKWLAAAFKNASVVALFYSVGTAVFAKKRVNGVWQGSVEWSGNVSFLSGLAGAYQGDWNLVVTGQDPSANWKGWTCLYGDGYSQAEDTWSSLAELTRASAGSQVEFHCPFLAYPDVFRLFFVEKYTGSGAYSRAFWSHTPALAEFVANAWREPVPFNFSTSYGLALAHSASAVWLSATAGVWRASLSLSPLAVIEDVLALSTEIGSTSGRARLELRNDHGKYLNLGSGAVAALKEGSAIVVSPGYHTSVGPECQAGPTFYIESWEHLAEGGRAELILYAHDSWGLLDNWKARYQFSWAAGEKNIFQLLSFLLARVGLPFSTLGYSPTLVNLYPAFTVKPEESGAHAVQRLLRMVPDVLFFREDWAYSKNPQANDSSDYAYGVGHPLLRGRYGSLSPQSNWVQVYGDGVFTEALSWDSLSRVLDRLVQIHDLNLDSLAEAQDRSQAALRQITLAASGGESRVPPNCGQELYDVVEVTEARAGLAAARRRVLGLALHYARRASHYEQRLLLGGV